MSRLFETEYLGRSKVASHFCRCDFCKRLTYLNSYTTRSFVKFLRIPIFPREKMQIIDECSQCGKRGITSAKKYAKERRKNLSHIKKDLLDKENAHRCAHALHTLMIYNMESRFNETRKSCACHFETNPQIQLLIAQGLSHFGHQDEAMIYCRKAIVLGAGEDAVEHLKHCETMLAATNSKTSKTAMKRKSAAVAYIPLILFIALLITGSIFLSKSSLNYSNAWIVNGTLQPYTFTIDDKPYTLSPGAIEKIKIRIGEHALKTSTQPMLPFTNNEPQIQQFINKTLLVINPDAMALIALPKMTEDDQLGATIYSYEGQIRVFENVRLFRKGLKRTPSPPSAKIDSVTFYRPQNHEEMITQLQRINQPKAAAEYARSTLERNPLTAEANQLIPLAVKTMDDSKTLAFLQQQLVRVPTLLEWHLYYQDYMKIHHPEADLEAEYYERCKQNILEPESQYLLARAAKDRSEAYQFYETSDQDYGMGGLGYYTIARDLYLHGNFDQALPFIQKSLQHDPAHKSFQELNENILLAQRNYKELLEQFLQSDQSNVSPNEVAKKKVLYLTCAGFHQEAVNTIIQHAKEGSTEYARLNAIRLYAIGNITGYLQNLQAAKDIHAAFAESLYEENIESAHEALAALDSASWQDHLLLYCAAMQQGNMDLAEQNIDQAIEYLVEENLTQQQIAALLREEKPIIIDSILEFDIEAPEKALLLVTLGWSNPELKSDFNTLAELYNFTPVYPQLFLEELLSD